MTSQDWHRSSWQKCHKLESHSLQKFGFWEVLWMRLRKRQTFKRTASHLSQHEHRWTGQTLVSRASQPVTGHSRMSLGRFYQEESCQLEPKVKEAGLHETSLQSHQHFTGKEGRGKPRAASVNRMHDFKSTTESLWVQNIWRLICMPGDLTEYISLGFRVAVTFLFLTSTDTSEFKYLSVSCLSAECWQC